MYTVKLEDHRKLFENTSSLYIRATRYERAEIKKDWSKYLSNTQLIDSLIFINLYSQSTISFISENHFLLFSLKYA